MGIVVHNQIKSTFYALIFKSAVVLAVVKKGNGKAVLTTVNGDTLTANMDSKNVILINTKGGKATVTATDLKGSNGIVHVISAVLLP